MIHLKISTPNRITNWLLILSLLLAGLAIGPKPAQAAVASELFISEYIEGSSNNKALEIYNGTGAAIDLAAGGYSIQMFFNGSASAGLTINLTGTVADQDVYVIAHSSAVAAILAQADQTNGSGWYNGDDAVVLRKGTTVIDSIGQAGFDPGTEWGSGLTSTADNTLRRKAAVLAGDTNPVDSFDPTLEWDGYATDTFDGLGSHTIAPPDNLPVSITCGSPISILEGTAASTTINASDPDGVVTAISIDAISPDPGTITLTGFTPAASAGGTASATLEVSAATPGGSYSVTLSASNNDAEPQTAACTLTVSVQDVLAIGEVQGQTTDTEDGLTDRSPYAPPSGNSNGQTVYTRGVITSKIISLSSSGTANKGFFIQSAPGTEDGDPLTSDGIFVFHGSFDTLRVNGGGFYTPQVGDEVLLRGPIVEFFNLTQLSNPFLIQVIRSGVDLEAEIPAFEANPPDGLAEANRYWERQEGMRARIVAGSLAVDGRDVFAGTADSEIWVIHPDHEVAQRVDPYARRVFRDPHPLDDIPDVLFDNGNGYRTLMGGMGVKATYNDNNLLLPPARTFDTITNDLVGGVYFSFSKYQIMVEQQPELLNGVDPALNAPPQAPDRSKEYSVVTYNLENLYDFRDDPTDGCDFAGNAGCPGVSPPFDYVPASQADYDTRVGQIAAQIVQDLHSPDLLMVQEVESQDICALVDGSLMCGSQDGADGRPDPLQDLAAAILALGGPQYDSAFDPDGADDRGIVSGFLFRADRVELLPVDAGHPVLGSSPQIDYRSAGLAYNSDVQNPKALNANLPADVDRSTGVDGSYVFTRAPQVGYFRIWRTGIGTSIWTDVYAISNHFSSTPNARVGQRTEQAAYNAAIVDALEGADPEAYVTVGGDLNVYPRPDDPFVPGDALFPSDQLGPLYDQGLTNLYDILLAEVPVSAYGYVFQGQTQVLDQMFANPALLAELVSVREAHINADWPADYFGDGPRGTSDHDPQAARYLNLVTIDRLEALVYYYQASGRIKGNNTVRLLIDRLERARAFEAKGQHDAYLSQLYAFTTQVQDFTPQFIDPAASAALIAEAEFLIQLSQ